MIDGRSSRALGAPGLVMVALTLAACGGGSDGGGGLQVSVDKTALEFTTVRSLEPAGTPNFAPMEIIHFNGTGGSGAYYAFVVLDRAGAFTSRIDYPSETSATVSLTLSVTAGFPVGDTTGQITFRLCPDTVCSTVAWEKVLPYTIHQFTVSTTPIALQASAGGAAVSRALQIAPVDTYHRVYATAVTSTPSATSPWLTVGRDGASAFQATATPGALSAGTWQGKIVVGIPGPYGVAVPVTFTVQ